MLSFAEEIYLLSLDDVSGKISLSGGVPMLHRALVGAVLCELAFMDRIDNDQEMLYLVATETTDDDMLDGIIDIINMRNKPESISFWIKNLLSEAKNIESVVLQRLIDKGILREIDERILWVFPSRRYPVIDDQEIQDVERRLSRIIRSEKAIPSPRDAVLISLTYACGILREVFSPKEYNRLEPRMKQLASLDFIARETARLIDELSVIMVDTSCGFR
jgi:hypothetical protein